MIGPYAETMKTLLMSMSINLAFVYGVGAVSCAFATWTCISYLRTPQLDSDLKPSVKAMPLMKKRRTVLESCVRLWGDIRDTVALLIDQWRNGLFYWQSYDFLVVFVLFLLLCIVFTVMPSNATRMQGTHWSKPLDFPSSLWAHLGLNITNWLVAAEMHLGDSKDFSTCFRVFARSGKVVAAIVDMAFGCVYQHFTCCLFGGFCLFVLTVAAIKPLRDKTSLQLEETDRLYRQAIAGYIPPLKAINLGQVPTKETLIEWEWKYDFEKLEPRRVAKK